VTRNPSEQLTAIINTLELELSAINDPATRAEIAHGVSERARLIQTIVAPMLRDAVQQMRDGGASHAEVAARLGVSRGRAQQLVGIPVRLVEGPCAGKILRAAPEGSGRPNRQLLVAVPGGIANYWRRVDPEPDGTWAADFYPGTTAPNDWITDLTVRS
jgi:hypothetical protein